MPHLNKNGLKKFLSYMVSHLKVEGMEDKFRIEEDCIRSIDDEDFQIKVFIKESSVINEIGPEGPVGQIADPAEATPAIAVSGRKTGTKRLGRANKQREEQATFVDLVSRLQKVFPTKDELQKHLKGIERDHKSVDYNQMQQAFADVSKSIGK